MGTGYYWINDKYKLKVYIGRHINDDDIIQSDLNEVFDNIFKEEEENYIDFYKDFKNLNLEEVRLIMNKSKYCQDLGLKTMSDLDIYFLNRIFGQGQVVTEYDDKMEETKDYLTLHWSDRFGSDSDE